MYIRTYIHNYAIYHTKSISIAYDSPPHFRDADSDKDMYVNSQPRGGHHAAKSIGLISFSKRGIPPPIKQYNNLSIMTKSLGH